MSATTQDPNGSDPLHAAVLAASAHVVEPAIVEALRLTEAHPGIAESANPWEIADALITVTMDLREPVAPRNVAEANALLEEWAGTD